MPRFIVFYNGVAKQPERQVYKLSDLFSREEKNPELELIVTVININRGYSRELLEKCESLRGYMVFVEKARDKKPSGMKLEKAVSQAVEECISEGILSDFFREQKKEIVEMGIYEFDQEVYERVLREDGEAIGIKKGQDRVFRIYRELQKGGTDNGMIAEACGCTIEEVETARERFGI